MQLVKFEEKMVFLPQDHKIQHFFSNDKKIDLMLYWLTVKMSQNYKILFFMKEFSFYFQFLHAHYLCVKTYLEKVINRLIDFVNRDVFVNVFYIVLEMSVQFELKIHNLTTCDMLDYRA